MILLKKKVYLIFFSLFFILCNNSFSAEKGNIQYFNKKNDKKSTHGFVSGMLLGSAALSLQQSLDKI